MAFTGTPSAKHVAVVVDLEHRCRVVPGSLSQLWLDIESERTQIEHVDKGIGGAHRIVLPEVVVDAIR